MQSCNTVPFLSSSGLTIESHVSEGIYLHLKTLRPGSQFPACTGHSCVAVSQISVGAQIYHRYGAATVKRAWLVFRAGGDRLSRSFHPMVRGSMCFLERGTSPPAMPASGGRDGAASGFSLVSVGAACSSSTRISFYQSAHPARSQRSFKSYWSFRKSISLASKSPGSLMYML